MEGFCDCKPRNYGWRERQGAIQKRIFQAAYAQEIRYKFLSSKRKRERKIHRVCQIQQHALLPFSGFWKIEFSCVACMQLEACWLLWFLSLSTFARLETFYCMLSLSSFCLLAAHVLDLKDWERLFPKIVLRRGMFDALSSLWPTDCRTCFESSFIRLTRNMDISLDMWVDK